MHFRCWQTHHFARVLRVSNDCLPLRSHFFSLLFVENNQLRHFDSISQPNVPESFFFCFRFLFILLCRLTPSNCQSSQIRLSLMLSCGRRHFSHTFVFVCLCLTFEWRYTNKKNHKISKMQTKNFEWYLLTIFFSVQFWILFECLCCCYFVFFFLSFFFLLFLGLNIIQIFLKFHFHH